VTYKLDPYTLKRSKIEPKVSPIERPDQVPVREASFVQQLLKDPSHFDEGFKAKQAYFAEPAQRAYRATGEAMNEATDGATGLAKSEYENYLRLKEQLNPFMGFSDDAADLQKAYNSAVSLDKRGKLVLKENLKKIQDQRGSGLLEKAENLQAFDEMNNPAYNDRRGPLAAFLGSIGSLIGYKSGGGYTGAAVGAGAGVGAGTVLGARNTVKNLIRKNAAVENAINNITTFGGRVDPKYGVRNYAPTVVNPMLQNSWSLMRPEEDQ
jgi:hypothetical protein